MLLFLGSGVSLKSGLPAVIELTSQVLDGIHKDPRGQDDKRPGSLEESQRLLRFLAELDSHYLSSIAPYKDKKTGTYAYTGSIYRRSTSYEDLFYLCSQITQSGMGLEDDPQTGALIDIIEQRAGGLLQGETSNDRIVYLYHLARRGRELIEHVVADRLHADEVLGLDFVVELARDRRVSCLDIVTLNHDTLVEQVLSDNGIEFVDGFGKQDGDVRLYDDAVYDSGRKGRVRLVKPHGSVNWYSPTINGKPHPAIVESGNTEHCRTADGQKLRFQLNKPSFLTGGNKVLAYNKGIFSEMFHRFHTMLRENSSMIMSGYGWSDAGVNFRLINWINRSRENRLLLLYERPELLASNSLQLDECYPALVKNGQIIEGDRFLDATTCSDLEKYAMV